jgi:signal peptidase I
MQQLALFDIDSAVVPSLKPGDWVKLRRKSTSAAYWKKGEVVQVESVHPQNGGARFWNDRTESWGYLHPGDVIPVSPPVDSVSVQPIARDTESTPEPVDTESIPPSVEFDSVSVQPIARDTESTPEPVDTESIPPSVEFDSVSVQPIARDTESTPEPVEFDSVSGPVATYRPKGTARGGEYFRFSYRAGGKMKHLHIPGGNTGSVLAQLRVAEVMELAAAGVPTLEICDRIKSWGRRNHLET